MYKFSVICNLFITIWCKLGKVKCGLFALLYEYLVYSVKVLLRVRIRTNMYNFNK